MAYTATKYLFLIFLFGFGGWASTSEFKDIKADDDIVYSEVDPQYHDAKCECGLCTEGQKYSDYHIDIFQDSVWIYSEDYKLIKKGDFDSLTQYILNDNL